MVMWERAWASLVWACAMGFFLVKNPRSARIVYRVQSLAEAALIGGFAVFSNQPALWLSVLLVVVVKAGAIPELIRRLTRGLEAAYGSQSRFGLASLLIMGLILTGLSLEVFRSGFPHPVLTGVLFGGWLLAFAQITVRFEVWSQTWAILSLETLTSSLMLVILNTLPLLADAGINLAALLAAALLAVLSARVAGTFGTTDARLLRELKG